MKELDLSSKDILSDWLMRQPRGRVVGIRNDPNRCALSRCLSETIGRRVTVRKGHANKTPLSTWARSFYMQADRSCGCTTGGYTVATALAVLDGVAA